MPFLLQPYLAVHHSPHAAGVACGLCCTANGADEENACHTVVLVCTLLQVVQRTTNASLVSFAATSLNGDTVPELLCKKW